MPTLLVPLVALVLGGLQAPGLRSSTAVTRLHPQRPTMVATAPAGLQPGAAVGTSSRPQASLLGSIPAVAIANGDDRPFFTATTSLLPLRINGEWYDVSGWADDHPGGRWLLEYARGRDVTALFRSIHLRSEAKAEAARPGY